MNRVQPLILLLLCAWIAPELASAAEFRGQIVCSQCWFEADRERVPYGDAADLACAARCAEKGIPPALALRGETGFELWALAGDRDWFGWIGRFARVEGAADEHDGKRVLRVDTIEALAASPWPAPSRETEPASLAWTDLGGRLQALESFRGRIVVLNFWATWCEPCRREMPDLVHIQNRYGLYGVQVLGAAADPPQAVEPVVEFARRAKINFPVFLAATTAQMESLGLGVALPGTVVLDREGRVVERMPGVLDRAKLEALLDEMLHGDHVRVASARGEASLVPS